MPPLVAAVLAARPLDDQLADPVLLLLQRAQLAQVGPAGAGGRGLRGTGPADQGGDLGSGRGGRALEPLLADEVGGARPCAGRRPPACAFSTLASSATMLGAGLLRSVEQRGLLAHQRVDGVHLAGDLGGVLRVQHHREPHQRRVTVGVVARGELADRRTLVDDRAARPCRGRRAPARAGARPPGAGPASARRRRAAASRLALRDREPALRGAERGASAGQPPRGAGRGPCWTPRGRPARRGPGRGPGAASS